MAAAITFFSGESQIYNMAGSGLGFYGPSGFGASVQVGSYQDHTFITDGAGVNQGPEAWNVKYLNAYSGIVGQVSSGIPVNFIPNSQASLNIRFTYDSAVNVQNATVQIYDRTTPSATQTGVTCQVAQLIHVNATQGAGGSGSTTWTLFTAGVTGTVQALANSPGVSGLFAGNGTNSTHTDVQHDWYVAISASPDSIGSKVLFGLYVSLEYL